MLPSVRPSVCRYALAVARNPLGELFLCRVSVYFWGLADVANMVFAHQLRKIMAHTEWKKYPSYTYESGAYGREIIKDTPSGLTGIWPYQ